jgi:hypothetical protein
VSLRSLLPTRTPIRLNSFFGCPGPGEFGRSAAPGFCKGGARLLILEQTPKRRVDTRLIIRIEQQRCVAGDLG